MLNQDIRERVNPVISPPPVSPVPGERKRRPDKPRTPRTPTAHQSPDPHGIAHIDEYAHAVRP